MRKISRSGSDPAYLFRHGGYCPAEGKPLLDFSVNVNPLGPPASALQSLRRSLTEIARYPDPTAQPLAERLAAHHGVQPTQVVVGNGSNDLIYAIAHCFRPRRAAIVEPTYTEYLRASLSTGATINHWLAEGDGYEPEPFPVHETDLVWLCQPNNPTGQLWSRARLEEWIEAHSRTLFVVDEAFMPFLADEPNHSLIAAAGRWPNLVVLRSLTKFYALPGLRLGYAVMSRQLAERVRAHLGPWSVNVLAQAAGLALLDEDAFRSRTHAWLKTERACFSDLLRNFAPGLQPLPSVANFLLIKLHRLSAAWLADRMAERGIGIRNASNFVGLDDHYIRLAVRSTAENQRLVEELHKVPEADRPAPYTGSAPTKQE